MSALTNNRIIWAIVILGLVGAGSVAYYDHHHNPASPTIKTTSQSANFISRKFDGPALGQGATFGLPLSFLDIPSSAQDASAKQHHSYHQQAKGSNTSILATAYISSIPSSNPPAQSKDLAKAAVQTVFPNLTITVTGSQLLSNSNINGNAWLFGFVGFNSQTNAVAQVGQVGYIIGNHSYYYFMLAAPQPYWQANVAQWGQIFDTLKINQ